jgi:hypothetical protein
MDQALCEPWEPCYYVKTFEAAEINRRRGVNTWPKHHHQHVFSRQVSLNVRVGRHSKNKSKNSSHAVLAVIGPALQILQRFRLNSTSTIYSNSNSDFKIRRVWPGVLYPPALEVRDMAAAKLGASGVGRARCSSCWPVWQRTAKKRAKVWEKALLGPLGARLA